MSNPLALLPLALAGGNGHVDEYEAQQLIAAGLTLLQRSAPLVRALGRRRAAILLPTSPRFFVALAASEGRGAVLINPLAAPAEIAFQIRDAEVGAVFTTSAFAARLPEGVAHVLLDDAPRTASVVVDGTVRQIDLGSHHGLSLQGEEGAEGRDEEAVIVYTSAMRGTPLGAVLTHRNLLANARSFIQAIGNTKDDRVLALLPLAHLFGLTVTASAPLLSGASVVTMERFHPAKAADLLADGGITEVVGVPAVFNAMLSGLARRDADLRDSALRLAICGGAELSVELQERWFEATGVELRQGYGLTEAAPVVLVNHAKRENIRGSLGHALPGVEVQIHRPADYASAEPAHASAVALPDGQPGEICVRGESVFPGYVRNEVEGLPRRDGWLATGDIGVRDVDGSIRFLGLLKPMFTRNGFNVYPRELERALMEMPGVVQAEVVGVPEPSRENDILMRVWGDVSEAEVREWCQGRLSAYKQPTQIEIVAP